MARYISLAHRALDEMAVRHGWEIAESRDDLHGNYGNYWRKYKKGRRFLKVAIFLGDGERATGRVHLLVDEHSSLTPSRSHAMHILAHDCPLC